MIKFRVESLEFREDRYEEIRKGFKREGGGVSA